MSSRERLEIVTQLSHEYGINLVDGFQLYEAIKVNNKMRTQDKLDREQAVRDISSRWNMSIELATESYDLAHPLRERG
jgi:predicted nucleic acid-binding protein